MSEWEASAAWRWAWFNWILLLGISFVFALCLLLTDFRIKPKGFLFAFGLVAAYGLIAYYFAKSPKRGNPQVVFAFVSIAQFFLLISLMTPVGYIATAANLPLRDMTLLAFDRALNLDFRSFLMFVNDRPALNFLLGAGYAAISYPVFLIALILPLAGYYRRVEEFIFAFAIGLIVTTCISTLIPATGVYGTIGLLPFEHQNISPGAYYVGLREISGLRDGTLRVLDLQNSVGVLTFPSFHAASAVMYAWALWPIRWSGQLIYSSTES